VTDAFRVRRAHWDAEHDRLVALRTRVFVEEQRVPLNEELDGRDPDCIHVAAETGDGAIIGTGRLMPEGRIGRMAVDPDWRGRGVGRVLLEALIACAREQGFATVELHAQTRAEGFYATAGFRSEGPVFDDAGIPHRRMWRDLHESTDPRVEGEDDG
jgi:predicted GNAT family N-acyltransferase